MALGSKRSDSAPPASLGPLQVLGQLGWLRGAMGAFLGIALAGAVTALLLSALGADSSVLPWIVAPLGASAVLVFAVPASPLAQPWPVIGGNLLSSLIGLTAGHLIAPIWLACAVAVGAAIAVMAMLRCLHPPGGACALLCALGAAGSSGAEAWGMAYLLPIAANVVLLALAGWAYNTLTGHAWPHRPAPAVPVVPKSLYQRQDLEDVLDEWGNVLDVDRDDLDQLIQAVEQRALHRQHSR